MEREDRISYFDKICGNFNDVNNKDIEKSLIEYIKIKLQKNNQLTIDSIQNKIIDIFFDENFPVDIEFLIEFFEFLLDKDNKVENGIVFTPKYISDFIVKDCLEEITKWNKNIKIIDPGCGCGIFLISAVDYIHNKFQVSIKDIIENNIYGIDIVEDNIRRCNFIMELYCIINNENYKKLKTNLISDDSLKCNWTEAFNVEKFDYIIGNPPYVNTHDMKKETINYLKNEFITTQTGVFNICYAFIEKGIKNIKKEGKLEFIIPNNILTIKSAIELRKLLVNNKNIEKIIDFSDNMIFKPVRTYNCIIKLNNQNHNSFEYAVIKKSECLDRKLGNLEYNEMDISNLDENGWKLVSSETLKNIKKIENQKTPIKDFIRTGIATLRDNVYFIDKDEQGFYKDVNGKRYNIDKDIVKPIYKIPELKKCDNPDDVLRYIIFPYYNINGNYKLIEENELKNKYENTYNYLLQMKNILDERDKGKKNTYAWYAYGRTQGLNKYGKKIVFPTFASNPKFRFIPNENALFCNGYAVFENETISLSILEKILNSKVMKYYICNTSYPIEGGYYCYQKKYIENFSIPDFNENELNILKSDDKDNIDKMLIAKYELKKEE